MHEEPRLLREVCPGFSRELISLLEAEDESDLAIRAFDLRIIAPCSCSDYFCQSFYTEPRPEGGYGAGHRNVVLDPDRGWLVLDVVESRIMFVEVLDYPPLSETQVNES